MWLALFEAVLEIISIPTETEPSRNKRRRKWAKYLFIFSLMTLLVAIILAPELYHFQHKALMLTLFTLCSLILGSITLALLILLKVIRSIYPQNFLLLFASISILYSIILCVLNLKFELIS